MLSYAVISDSQLRELNRKLSDYSHDLDKSLLLNFRGNIDLTEPIID